MCQKMTNAFFSFLAVDGLKKLYVCVVFEGTATVEDGALMQISIKNWAC